MDGTKKMWRICFWYFNANEMDIWFIRLLSVYQCIQLNRQQSEKRTQFNQMNINILNNGSCEKTIRFNWVYRFDRYSMFFNRICCRLSNLKVCAVSVVADCVTLLCLNVNTIEQSATHFHSTPIIHHAPHFPYFLFFIVDGISICFFFSSSQNK